MTPVHTLNLWEIAVANLNLCFFSRLPTTNVFDSVLQVHLQDNLIHKTRPPPPPPPPPAKNRFHVAGAFERILSNAIPDYASVSTLPLIAKDPDNPVAFYSTPKPAFHR